MKPVPTSPIPPPETIAVETTTFFCDGGDTALGHPRVYLTLGADGTVDCPYCDRHFIAKGAVPDRHDPSQP
jgi:uncharacterized Zn-finger protein